MPLLQSEEEGEVDWEAVVLLVPVTELHTSKGVVIVDREARGVAVTLILDVSEAEGLT